jgi:N-hydroxyarylamine O-acetyltransferase
LRQLHLQHNSAIPFENLDVLLPREIHLDDLALEAKLIAGRRGGIVLNKMACWSARCAK